MIFTERLPIVAKEEQLIVLTGALETQLAGSVASEMGRLMMHRVVFR
jgi:hypothetical protein